MSLMRRLERPRWAVVVYQDNERICVLESFLFRVSARSCADGLNSLTQYTRRAAGHPAIEHRVERVHGDLDPGERCVQH